MKCKLRFGFARPTIRNSCQIGFPKGSWRGMTLRNFNTPSVCMTGLGADVCCMLETLVGLMESYCWLIKMLKSALMFFGSSYLHQRQPKCQSILVSRLASADWHVIPKAVTYQAKVIFHVGMIKARPNWFLLQYINTSRTNLNVKTLFLKSLTRRFLILRVNSTDDQLSVLQAPTRYRLVTLGLLAW